MLRCLIKNSKKIVFQVNEIIGSFLGESIILNIFTSKNFSTSKLNVFVKFTSSLLE